MAIFARAGADLFFRVLLVAVSNSWTDRPCGNSSGRRVPAGGSKFPGARAILVRTDCVVAERRRAHVARIVLDGAGRLAAADVQYLAARHAGGVLCVFTLVRERRVGILRLSIGWHAAGGGIYFVLLRATETTAWVGSDTSAVVGQLIPAAMGMVSNLL